MKKAGFMRWILLAGSVLILIGVALMLWMLLTADDRTVIKIDLGLEKPVHFNELCLIPGEEVYYDLEFNGNKMNQYTVYFDFVDLDESKKQTLKNYARVKIEAGEEILYDELLADAFEGKAFTLPVDFDTGLNTKLTVVCYLPIDVGNEAENAEADFDLLIKASNE